MKQFIILLVLILILSCASGFDDSRAQYNVWLANAEFLLQEPETYNKALDAVNKALTYVSDGNEAKVLKEKILKIIKNHERELARQKAEREPKIEIEESVGSDLVSQGYAFAKKQEFDKAARVLVKAIEENPSSFEACINLGYVYEKLGRLDKAEEIYKKALEIRPSSGIAHNNLGYLYAKLHLSQKAIEQCEMAVKYEPDNVSYLDSLAYAQIIGEKYDLAQNTIQKAKKISANKPVSPMLKFHEGLLEINNKNYDKALELMKDASSLFPESFEINSNMANVYFSIEKGKEAYECVQKALNVVPDSVPMNFQMGFFEMIRENLVKSLEFFKKAADKGKDTSEGYFALAMIKQLELRMGSQSPSPENIDFIIENLNSAILKRPTWWMPHFIMGQFCLGAGRNDLAKEQLNIALQYVPEALKAKVEEVIAQVNNQPTIEYYVSEKNHFRMMNPGPPWQVTEDGSRFGIADAACVFYNEGDSIIAILLANNVGRSPEELREEKIASRSIEAQGFNMVKKDNYKVGDANACEMVYDEAPGRRFLQSFFISHNIIVCVAGFSVSHDVFDTHYETFQKMIKSFEFVE